jgi:GT2 family glycosyltransferase
VAVRPGAKDKRLSLVVPTVGRSALLAQCLEALRKDAGEQAEILVVAQGEAAGADFGSWADQVIRRPEKLGFAAANNLGFRAASGEYVGTINDDAVIEPGFCARLCALLDENEKAAAVQGVNLQLGDPGKVDGAGIGFNKWWQAVQLGLGEEAVAMPASPVEIFGVSATAAIYRRSTLEKVALPGGQFFAEELFTYYEDVELAARLRQAGFEAWLEPRARAAHAGSASLSTLRFAGRTLIHGNRLPVVARLLGGAFWRRLPLMLLREARDFGRLVLTGKIAGAWGVTLGFGRGLRLLPQFARSGEPAWPLARLARPELPPDYQPAGGEEPLLAGVVVHWKNEEELAELVAAWPAGPKTELLVVDNSGSITPEVEASWQGKARRLDPGGNRGFGGGVNAGVAATKAPWVLVLNPDARPLEGAIEKLAAASETERSAAGLVPALQWPNGESQCSWQLQPLPSALTLLAQIFFFGGKRGPQEEPRSGTTIEQPAAAALALRREVLEELGGFDEGFFPAWFEDVDMAKRLAEHGHFCAYLPESRFEHAAGSSLPALGYGPFLFVYYRNLVRYLQKHHGGSASLFARSLLPVSMLLRIALLPCRRPTRARSRKEALTGLAAVVWGAITGFRCPRHLAARFPSAPEGRV